MTALTLLPVLLLFRSFQAAATTEAPPPQPAAGNPDAVISTSAGDITVELFKDRAPVSVAIFLAYRNKGFYEGTIFHRVISGFTIQGRGFSRDLSEKPTSRPPTRNEAINGLNNVRGTPARARSEALRSATSPFFINVAENRSIPDHRGYSPGEFAYAVFGRVLSGMEVCDRIAAVNTRAVGPHRDVPVEPIVIKGVRAKL